MTIHPTQNTSKPNENNQTTVIKSNSSNLNDTGQNKTFVDKRNETLKNKTSFTDRRKNGEEI